MKFPKQHAQIQISAPTDRLSYNELPKGYIHISDQQLVLSFTMQVLTFIQFLNTSFTLLSREAAAATEGIQKADNFQVQNKNSVSSVALNKTVLSVHLFALK